MKLIKYKYLSGEINIGTEETPNMEQVFSDKEIYCPTEEIFHANYPIAEKEAVGEIVVEGEFDPEPEPVETTDDVLNALLGVYE